MTKSTRNQILAGLLVAAIAAAGSIYCLVYGLPF